ncbi:hypothetical protein AKJ46_00215 [candidate division MSBL1 archaeon SCGC-AAA833K04]|uniref:Transposase IS701-like DDE domain-containing protein n=1 Tax=candidate division MSBL1 archaeon SCGC-AAA833K04 TaxID=1698258 RepID=A0A133VST0_9EURY|nr:hypothetical protein AKJ46_00215 [candidate division MSBL1 archaeon SCGC-AAA833K04]
MLKIAHAPKKLKTALNEFRDEFTRPSHESFSQIMGSMINSEGKRTISGLQKRVSGGKSRTAFEYFFNEGKWNEDSVAQKKADYFFREARVGPGIGFAWLSTTSTWKRKRQD